MPDRVFVHLSLGISDTAWLDEKSIAPGPGIFHAGRRSEALASQLLDIRVSLQERIDGGE